MTKQTAENDQSHETKKCKWIIFVKQKSDEKHALIGLKASC